ncbi:MAG: hypothetical protein JWO62_66, partial [Acidimicrobiaceae bacterium]|nr:hypothetical protein [Acidimicrobiaceae bacterium]
QARDEGVRGPLCRHLGVPTAYVAHAKPDTILARLGLDPAGIARATRESLLRLDAPLLELGAEAARAAAVEPLGN